MRRMFVSISMALALAVPAVVQAHGETPDVSAAEVLSGTGTGSEQPDAQLILDVRTPEEYREGHVPGAINVPHSQISDRLEELAEYRDRDVVVYCKSGRRAGFAARELSEAGFRVYHLDGDMDGWRSGNHPETKLPAR